MYCGMLLLLDDSQSTLSLNKLFTKFVRSRLAATTFFAAIGLEDPVWSGDPAGLSACDELSVSRENNTASNF